MAYSGYLLKLGDYTFPLSLIKADTYSPYKSVTDLDSYVDGEGVLHRNALDHVGYKTEFETVPMLTDKTFGALMSNIYSQFINEKERKLLMTIFIPELNDYITTEAYMPDIKPQIYYADANKIQYDAVRFAFISY